MKKILIVLFLLLPGFDLPAQDHQMFVQNRYGKLKYKIKPGQMVKIKQHNRHKCYGRIRFQNDSQFILGTDTLHVDSISSILRFRTQTLLIGPVVYTAGAGLVYSGYLIWLEAEDMANSGFFEALASIFYFIIGAAVIVVGAAASVVGYGLSIPLGKSIDGKNFKLVIKKIPEKVKTADHP